MNSEENNEQSIDSLDVVKEHNADSSAPVSRTRLIHIIKRRPWGVVVVVLLAVFAIALTLLLRPGSGSQGGRPVPAPTGEPVPSPSEGGMQLHPGEITITLTPDKLEAAQIKTEVATALAVTAAVGGGIRTTGTVQSNAYKEVP